MNLRWFTAICKSGCVFASKYRSGRSVAWYARLLGVQEVVSSNLTAPTICSSALFLIGRFDLNSLAVTGDVEKVIVLPDIEKFSLKAAGMSVGNKIIR